MMRLDRHARRNGSPLAAMARQILREGLVRQEAVERTRKLATDYSGGRADAQEILADLEQGQLALLGENEKD